MLDAHLHLCDDTLHQEADIFIDDALKNHVEQFLCVVTNEDELKKAFVLKKKYPMVRIAASTTPHDAQSEIDPFFECVKRAAIKKDIHAIGETGLEYFHPGLDRDLQKKYLRQYLELACSLSMPLVFHCRDAFDDLFNELAPYRGRLKGMIHCFTGSYEDAKKAIELGLLISISGIVTYKNSHALQVCVSKLPLESILVETDSPYLAPLSKRGQTNRPAFIKETYQKIAYLKNLSVQELERHVLSNYASIF